jgi:hypothetical protein
VGFRRSRRPKKVKNFVGLPSFLEEQWPSKPGDPSLVVASKPSHGDDQRGRLGQAFAAEEPLNFAAAGT